MGTIDTSVIDGRVSIEQCKKAIAALLKHVRKQQQKEDESELLPGKEQHVWLVMTVKRMQPLKSLKPQKILIEHPLVDPRTTSVCLITKDPQREYKDLLDSHNIKFISRVVGVEKLKGKFKGFDARRLLLHENGLFLADERVIPLLPGLLGKQWFKAKKQPIPVSLTKKDLKGELEKAISSTYMHQNQGTCTSIKIANISHKDSQVLSNLKAALTAVVARIHGGWDNVQSFNIKTSSSASLPIWTCPLGSDEPGSRWGGMSIDEDEWGGIADGGNDEFGEPVEPVAGEPPVLAATTTNVSSQANDKKRAAGVDGEIEGDPGEKNRKRVKKIKVNDAPSPTSAVDTIEASEPSKDSEAKPRKPRKPRTRPAKDGPSLAPPPSAAPTASDPSHSAPEPPSSRVTSTESHTLPLAVGSDQRPSRKLRKKHRDRAEVSSSVSSGDITLSKSLPDRAVSPKEQGSEHTLTREDMKKKKDALGDAKIEKKKRKLLKKAENGARKGVKAQLIGQVKS